MIFGKLGDTIKEDFTVVNLDQTPVSGLDSTAFTILLFNPNDTEVGSSIIVTITELGQGNYRAKFTPNMVGIWYLIIKHDTYFAAGKADTIQIFANDFDSITSLINRVLGLVQENFYIDQTLYDSNNNLIQSRIRTYTTNIDVGTETNVQDTYYMTATYNTEGEMTNYKVIKLWVGFL